MNELITEIREVKFEFNRAEHEGFQIVTNKRTIRFGIATLQQCCERTGYVCSEDNLQDFELSLLINFKVVDTELKSYEYNGHYPAEYQIIFLNLETSKGLLQFAVYNEHNGYYGHDVLITEEKVTQEYYI